MCSGREVMRCTCVFREGSDEVVHMCVQGGSDEVHMCVQGGK